MKLKKEISAFAKAQVSAFAGGIIDFLIMLIAVEYFHLHYVIGIAAGGIIGALVNFTINRIWSFDSVDDSAIVQMRKFILVVIGSIVLKSAGTSLLTEGVQLDYRLSRLITDLIVSLGFNYSLQRLWVFKKGSLSVSKDL